MNRRGVLLAAAAVVATVLVVASASARPAHLWRGIELSEGTRSPTSVRPAHTTVPPTSTLPPLARSVPSEPMDLGFLVYVMWGLFAALVCWLVWWLTHRDWQRTDHRPRTSFEPLPPVDVDLSEAADDLDVVLARGSPRNAIVACWARLEDAVEEAGIRRDPSETSEEMTTRVLRSEVVDAGAIESLAALYREARFSTHELTEQHRRRAREALDVLREQLRAGVGEGAEL